MKYVYIQNAVFDIIHFRLFSNAGQSQSETIADVILKWFGWVVAKICFKRTIPKFNCRKEAIHGRTDWNFSTYKLRFIRAPLFMVYFKLLIENNVLVNIENRTPYICK
jgi:hypothetical protein